MRASLFAAVAMLTTLACSSTPQRTIGGTVSGLAGSGLVLQDNGGDDLSITSDGPFAFKKPVTDGAAYSVTVSQQPTNPSQVCTVAQSSAKAIADVKDVAVTCVTSAFTVSGTVAGLSGTGLVLQDNGGDDLTVKANGTFSFATPVPSGHAFTVSIKTQPSNPTETCKVSGGSGTIGAAGVSSVMVNCSVNNYAIGGTVAGLAGTGLVLQDNGGDDLPVSANGSFAFAKTVASAQAFAVTVKTQPTQPSQTCVVASGTGTVTAGDVTTVAVQCTTNSYKVNGTVTGLLGSGLQLQDNNGDNISPAADGTFAFPTPVASGTTYSVTVSTQPTAPSQTCTVSSGTGTIVDADVSSVTVACVTNKYNVGGTVVGLSGTGLTLTDNGGDSLPITASGTFQFPTQVASGATFTAAVSAQPTSPSQTCTVAGGSGTVGGADVTSITVNCTTNNYAVGGTVSGLAGTGLTLKLGNGAPLQISGNGAYAFPTLQPSGSTYAVTVASQPTQPWQTCTVSNGNGTVGGGPVTNVNVQCVKNSYSVTGTVTGLAGSGLVLQDNGGDNLAVSGNGSFKFPIKIVSGQAYAVTVFAQPSVPSQTCTVSSGSGNVAGGDVTSVAVACVTNTYNIKGTVSGLAGTVVLQDNGGDNLTVNTNGAFTFATKVASNAPYAVTVLTQPATPSQTCTVANGSGTVSATDVSNVAITCVTNQFAIGGTVSGLAGNGLQLQDNGGDTLSITGNGPFKFATKINSGATYAVTVSQNPASPTQTCVVTGGTGSVGGSDVTTVAVNCTTNTYAISGTVSGLLGTGLALQDNGGDTVQVSGSGSFSFPTLIPSGGTYAVTVSSQPTSPWQTCSVAQGSGTVTNAAVTNVAVTCVSNPYNVNVSVTGLAGSGLVLQDNGGDNLAVSSNGTATFATKVQSGKTYNVTVLTQPTSKWQTCSAAQPTGTVAGGDVTVAIACVTNTYSIGGTVTGLTNTGLVLQDNGGDNLSIGSSGGAFAFPTKIASGATYSVTIATQPVNQQCFLSSNTGTVAGSNVTSVTVSCQGLVTGGGTASNPWTSSPPQTKCLGYVQKGISKGDGGYIIQPGSTPLTVYCDMTDGGVTFESFGFGQFNASYSGYALTGVSSYKGAVQVPAAFVFHYNRLGGLPNLQPGFNSSNCCFVNGDTNNSYYGFNGTGYMYPANNNGSMNCNSTYTDSIMKILLTNNEQVGRSSFLQAEVANTGTYTGCGIANNPGIFVKRYQ